MLNPIKIRLTILMNYRGEHFTEISLSYIGRYVNIIKLKVFVNDVILFKLKLISLEKKNSRRKV